MATHVMDCFTAINCAGNYTGIRHRWRIVDPTDTNPFRLAKELRDGFTTVGAGTPLYDELVNVLAIDCFIQSTRCRQLLPTAGSTAAEIFTATEYPGTLGTDTDAGQVAGCLVWITSGQDGLTGRNFIPGVAEDSIVDGRFDTSYVDNMVIVRDTFVAGFDTASGTWEFVIGHGTPATYTPVVGGYLSPTPGTQRRRLTPW